MFGARLAQRERSTGDNRAGLMRPRRDCAGQIQESSHMRACQAEYGIVCPV